MSSSAIIHVAHSAHRKGGLRTFHAVAVVTDPSTPGFHTKRTAVDDTPEEAEARAVNYITDTYEQGNLPAPATTIRHGRRPAAIVDQVTFVTETL